MLRLVFPKRRRRHPAADKIYPPDDSIATIEKESRKIEDAILATTGGIGLDYGGLLAPLGKNWCLSNVLMGAAPKHAALYGWACPPGYTPPTGVPLHKGTLAGVMNIQPLATPHSDSYDDYAQLISLVRRNCTFDGRPVDLQSIMQSADSTIWPLVSHEGPLRVLRRPGCRSCRRFRAHRRAFRTDGSR